MKTQTRAQEKKVDLRIVDVIARYEEKRNGKLTGVVIYSVRPSEKTLEHDPEAQPYRVVFFEGKLQQCSCRGYREFGHCYHSDELVKREQSHSRVTQDAMPGLHNSRPLRIEAGVPMR